MELTKDNIYTRMMDLAHQALLSRGLDLLILVFPAPSLQPTYNEFETIMNVVATKSSAEPDLCRAYYHYAKEGHECPTLGRKGFQLRPGFLCLHELRSSTESRPCTIWHGPLSGWFFQKSTIWRDQSIVTTFLRRSMRFLWQKLSETIWSQQVLWCINFIWSTDLEVRSFWALAIFIFNV